MIIKPLRGENQYNIGILIALHVSYFKKYVFPILGKEIRRLLRRLQDFQSQSLIKWRERA